MYSCGVSRRISDSIRWMFSVVAVDLAGGVVLRETAVLAPVTRKRKGACRTRRSPPPPNSRLSSSSPTRRLHVALSDWHVDGTILAGGDGRVPVRRCLHRPLCNKTFAGFDGSAKGAALKLLGFYAGFIPAEAIFPPRARRAPSRGHRSPAVASGVPAVSPAVLSVGFVDIAGKKGAQRSSARGGGHRQSPCDDVGEVAICKSPCRHVVACRPADAGRGGRGEL